MEQGTGTGALATKAVQDANGASSTFTGENSRAAVKPEGEYCPWTRKGAASRTANGTAQLEKFQKRAGCPSVRKGQKEVESFSLAELEFWM